MRRDTRPSRSSLVWSTAVSRSALFPLFLLTCVLACNGREARPAVPLVAPPSSGLAAAPAAGEPVHVRLLAFNDFHGNLMPPTQRLPKMDVPLGGAAYFAAHVKKLSAGHPNTLLVSAGDIIGASPLTSALFHDEPTIEVMNAMGLTATTIGNHELDEGVRELERVAHGGCHPKDGCKFESAFAGAKFDYLAANMTASASSNPPLPPYVVRDVAGIRIAFVGMPLEGTPHSVTPEAISGLAFDDEVKTANALVPELRAKGIETMVLLIHEGGETKNPGLDECTDLKGPIVRIVEKLDPAYDVVVSGHTHQLYNCTVAGRPVTSASSFGRVITAIDLDIDPTSKNVVRAEAHNHAVTHDIEPDKVVEAIVDRALAAAAPLENRVIGRITETLTGDSRGGRESTLGPIVADAQLEATRKAGATIAVMNAAGLRTDIVYAKSGAEKEDGLVTYGEAFAAQPFANGLVTLTISGEELAKVLERQLRGNGVFVSEGLVVHWDRASGAPPKLLLRGKPVAPSQALRVTANSFLAERDPGFAKATDRVPGPGDLEAFEQYFSKHKTVRPPTASRIVKP